MIPSGGGGGGNHFGYGSCGGTGGTPGGIHDGLPGGGPLSFGGATLHATTEASMIVISSHSDSYQIEFRDGDVTWLEYGGSNGDMPDLVTIPLTQRIPVSNVFLACSNLVEDCEITVSIVGD